MRHKGVQGQPQRIAAVAVLGVAVMAGGAAAQQSRVFVTSTTSNGNLFGVGGLAGGDQECEARAAAANLGGGPWVAWLSTSTGVDARDRLTATGPFVRASNVGTTIADDIADLTDNTLDASIRFDESGNFPSAETAWTGTDGDGTVANATCIDWTSNSESGVVGVVSATDTAGWTNAFTLACVEALPLYCFEQAPTNNVPTLPLYGLTLLTVLLVAAGASFIYRRNQATR